VGTIFRGGTHFHYMAVCHF